MIIASISGGKDSAAMSLHFQEVGIEHRRIFADTGWEHPSTYDYVSGPLTQALGPIEWVRSPIGGMVDWVRKKGTFPRRTMRFCTEELKVKPIQAVFKSLLRSDPNADLINAVGIRSGESRARAAMLEWDGWRFAEGFVRVWRPILQWSLDDVIGIHRRHGLVPNPLYLQGATRVGCWPCIFARKAEIALVGDLTPERIDEIRGLETELSERGGQRTFFMPRESGGKVDSAIDEVVAWASTDRGGQQHMLDLDDEEPGCVRWGMCDTGEKT